ncbi:HAMP domain-containing sensor histidine kinase [Methanocalculus sp.]|uniref:sensor histidine kinase n=1 Tax=Methanocalculus sp. TaxID=2004547 RepID=UPI00272D5A43|nr:HAMP domain-containing sensor histidine kinase [Methanocalculus sp.]
MITPFNGRLPLAIIIITTAISIGVGFASLSSGIYGIFQSFFYIPIILACIFYLRRGLVFSTILAAFYFFLFISFAGPEYLPDGMIQVLLFISIAFVVTMLSEKSKGVERSLEKMNEELVQTNTALLDMNDQLARTEDKMLSQLNVLLTTEQALRDEIERKTDFVTIASHELRTPLQPALGYLSLITSDPEGFGLSDDVVVMLTSCLKYIDQQRKIIDRMLELSLVGSGKIVPVCESIHLHEFIEGIIIGSIGGSEAQVKNEIPPDVIISGDRSLLNQVFAGLISNAIRFSNPPRIVTLEYQREATGHAIRVIDNGIGIDASVQKKIFEPFHIADLENLSRNYDRLGLGLPIAMRYVELHGGDITLVSTPGQGSAPLPSLSRITIPEVKGREIRVLSDQYTGII